MRHQLRTEIEIEASPDVVWDILTDIDRYADWNPFIVSAAGTLEMGERLENRMQPPGGKEMTFKPVITALVPGETFEWLGRALVPGIFDGRHRFELAVGPNGGTRVVHGKQFSGVLVRFMRKSLDTQTMQGFQAMNVALKERAETTDRSRS